MAIQFHASPWSLDQIVTCRWTTPLCELLWDYGKDDLLWIGLWMILFIIITTSEFMNEFRCRTIFLKNSLTIHRRINPVYTYLVSERFRLVWRCHLFDYSTYIPFCMHWQGGQCLRRFVPNYAVVFRLGWVYRQFHLPRKQRLINWKRHRNAANEGKGQLSIGYGSYGNQTWPIKWNAVSSRQQSYRYCCMDAVLRRKLNGWRRS